MLVCLFLIVANNVLLLLAHSMQSLLVILLVHGIHIFHFKNYIFIAYKLFLIYPFTFHDLLPYCRPVESNLLIIMIIFVCIHIKIKTTLPAKSGNVFHWMATILEETAALVVLVWVVMEAVDLVSQGEIVLAVAVWETLEATVPMATWWWSYKMVVSACLVGSHRRYYVLQKLVFIVSFIVFSSSFICLLILSTFLEYILFNFNNEPDVAGYMPSVGHKGGLIPVSPDFRSKFLVRR